jgi:hypothetical protein|tara:strand:- start:8334 stop:9131 length:798 start_codon:yes stop_codon:yes gene_type:complete
MKDITKLKDGFYAEYVAKCKSYSGSCELEDLCICKLAAELKAYEHAILPRGFQNFNIFDFDGTSPKGEELLPRQVVLNIKNRISKYCWDISYPELFKLYNEDSKTVLEKSVMDKRRADGNCVVIYGQSMAKLGRSLVASIIMREAIKRRFVHPSNALQLYDWVEFIKLQNVLINRESNGYEFYDWLVVDNINDSFTKTSANAQNYLTSKLDPFFISRCEQRLPTIFVFRFDIMQEGLSIQENFGFGIQNIINDKDTMMIDLTIND